MVKDEKEKDKDEEYEPVSFGEYIQGMITLAMIIALLVSIGKQWGWF